MSKRKIIFLKDVFVYTLTAFGGPTAHLALLLKHFVKERRYINEEELLEFNSLSNILPGPSSTQTICAISHKIGGLPLAILTFLIWVMPSAFIMVLASVVIAYSPSGTDPARVFRFIEPMALGVVCYASVTLIGKFIRSRLSIILFLAAVLTTVFFKSPYLFPLLIIGGGIVASFLKADAAERELEENLIINVNRKKVATFFGILVLFALLGAIINRTSYFSLPVRLFENFYRNGVLVFGGGQVLVPLMYTEFVELKEYLTSKEFLSGFALQQTMPGPTFSFVSYLGGMAMKNQGVTGQLIGGMVAVIGINLPGLILVLFILPFWDNLKKINRIKNSLFGVNAVAVGLVTAAPIIMLQQVAASWFSIVLMILTFLLLLITKVPSPLLFIGGILLGLLI